jgi:hypothetical protein
MRGLSHENFWPFGSGITYEANLAILLFVDRKLVSSRPIRVSDCSLYPTRPQIELMGRGGDGPVPLWRLVVGTGRPHPGCPADENGIDHRAARKIETLL